MTGRAAGKVVFLTGAARGQGRSHAVRLAEEGADVIAVDVCEQVPTAQHDMPGPADLDETVRLVEQAGGRILATRADVRDHEALRAALDAGVAEFGKLDAVVANAGIAAFLPHETISAQAWADMIDINLTGVWFTCQVALPHLIANGAGSSIVITSSTAGAKGIANVVHYTAAKHGVLGVMRTLAKELAPHLIRVNAVLPTAVDTPMFQHQGLYDLYRPDLESPTREDAMPAFVNVHTLPVPWVDAADVTNAVLFLISDESRYVTGVPLPVDAGKSQR